MLRDAQAGQRLLIAIIGLMLAFDVLTSIAYNIVVGQDQAVPQLIRLGLTALFAYLLYIGVRWIKWLLIVFLVMGGLLAVASLLISGVTNPISLMTVVMGLYFLVAAGMLAFSSSISVFLRAQRQRRRPDDTDNAQRGA